MFLASLTPRRFRITLMGALVAMLFSAQLAPAQTFTVLHSFTGGADGSSPTAGLTLLGTSLYGAAGRSALFRLRRTGQNWTFNPIFEFSENGSDGLYPLGRVAFGRDGALYGSAGSGGIPDCLDGGGCGLIFSMRPPRTICTAFSCPWTETILYEFNPVNLPTDGWSPNGGLIFDSSNNVYGTTIVGGLTNAGTVFQLVPGQGGWTENVIYTFHQQQLDGIQPNGSLVMDRAGNIFGTTQTGGFNDCYHGGCGIVFELTPTGSGWTETILHTFVYASDGSEPTGGLISDNAGNLYGVTGYGGPNNGGTVYELTPSNGGYTFQVIYSFSGNPSIEGPIGVLAIDGNGNLYGATGGEGALGHGMIYKLTAVNGNWTSTDLHDFSGGEDGGVPQDGPTLDPSGNLYGTTLFGGTGSCDCGVVWQITP